MYISLLISPSKTEYILFELQPVRAYRVDFHDASATVDGGESASVGGDCAASGEQGTATYAVFRQKVVSFRPCAFASLPVNEYYRRPAVLAEIFYRDEPAEAGRGYRKVGLGLAVRPFPYCGRPHVGERVELHGENLARAEVAVFEQAAAGVETVGEVALYLAGPVAPGYGLQHKTAAVSVVELQAVLSAVGGGDYDEIGAVGVEPPYHEVLLYRVSDRLELGRPRGRELGHVAERLFLRRAGRKQSGCCSEE